LRIAFGVWCGSEPKGKYSQKYESDIRPNLDPA